MCVKGGGVCPQYISIELFAFLGTFRRHVVVTKMCRSSGIWWWWCVFLWCVHCVSIELVRDCSMWFVFVWCAQGVSLEVYSAWIIHLLISWWVMCVGGGGVCPQLCIFDRALCDVRIQSHVFIQICRTWWRYMMTLTKFNGGWCVSSAAVFVRSCVSSMW